MSSEQKQTETGKLFPIKRILVPIDGSENAFRAAQVAVNLAKYYNSELIILHVIPMPSFIIQAPVGLGAPPSSFNDYYDYAEKEAKNWTDTVLALAREKNVTARAELLRTTSSVVDSIAQNALGEKVDLIVIGTRGLGGFRKLLIGSVSSGVVTHAHCSVLVVR